MTATLFSTSAGTAFLPAVWFMAYGGTFEAGHARKYECKLRLLLLPLLLRQLL